jgi:hypothetical protein
MPRLALHAFDHLTYTYDEAVLIDVVLPALRGIAKFFLEYLWEDPITHTLHTGPSTSPENSYQIFGDPVKAAETIHRRDATAADGNSDGSGVAMKPRVGNTVHPPEHPLQIHGFQVPFGEGNGDQAPVVIVDPPPEIVEGESPEDRLVPAPDNEPQEGNENPSEEKLVLENIEIHEESSEENQNEESAADTPEGQESEQSQDQEPQEEQQQQQEEEEQQQEQPEKEGAKSGDIFGGVLGQGLNLNLPDASVLDRLFAAAKLPPKHDGPGLRRKLLGLFRGASPPQSQAAAPAKPSPEPPISVEEIVHNVQGRHVPHELLEQLEWQVKNAPTEDARTNAQTQLRLFSQQAAVEAAQAHPKPPPNIRAHPPQKGAPQPRERPPRVQFLSLSPAIDISILRQVSYAVDTIIHFDRSYDLS